MSLVSLVIPTPLVIPRLYDVGYMTLDIGILFIMGSLVTMEFSFIPILRYAKQKRRTFFVAISLEMTLTLIIIGQVFEYVGLLDILRYLLIIILLAFMLFYQI